MFHMLWDMNVYEYLSNKAMRIACLCENLFSYLSDASVCE